MRILLTAVLAFCGFVCADCAPVQTVHARLGGCHTNLTLNLTPGFHISNVRGFLHGLHWTVAKDLPRTPTVVRLPLYSGMQRSSLPLHTPDISYPASPYLKSASVTYLSRDRLSRIYFWYRHHVLACGYALSGLDSVSSAPALGYPDGTVTFRKIRNPRLQVEIAFERVRHGVLVLYEAEQIVLPPRPANTYVPSDVISINLQSRYPGLPTAGTISRPDAVRSLVHAVNSLSLSDGASVSCEAEPPGGDNINLTFIQTHGPPVRVTDDPACGGLVHVGHTRALQDQPGGIWDTLHRIIRNGWLEG